MLFVNILLSKDFIIGIQEILWYNLYESKEVFTIFDVKTSYFFQKGTRYEI